MSNINKPLAEDLVSFLSESFSESEIMLIREQAKIAATLHAERIKRKNTQKEFAAMLGVNQEMVSKWESGEYNFTLESLSQLCCMLNLDMTVSMSVDQSLAFCRNA